MKKIIFTSALLVSFAAAAQDLRLLNDNLANTVNGTGSPTDYTDNELAALWLDGGTNDSSENGNNGAMIGSPAYTTGADGITNHALAFNGSQGVTIGTAGSFGNFTNQPFSLTMWLNEKVGGTYLPVISGNHSANGYFMKIDSVGHVLFYNTAGGNVATTTAPLSVTNTFYFIAVTWTSNTATIYVNGVSKGSGTLTNFVSSTTYPFCLGGEYTDSIQYGLNGVIDDFRVWGASLTTNVISQLYLNGAF
jgi:hypothetical protein